MAQPFANTPPDLLALLTAYKANPLDDVRGLVLADWLEEHGDPLLAARAEFVRLQCRGPRFGPKKDRQDDLLRHFGERWLGPLKPVADSAVWERGLLHLGAVADVLTGEQAQHLTADDFAWVEGLTVRNLTPEGAVLLATAPWLVALTTLELRGQLGAGGARTLAGSPHLSGIHTLLARGTGVRDSGAAALAGAPALTNLSVLSLASNRIRDEGAQALAASPHLAHMTQLNLEGNRFGHPGLSALRAAAQAHPRLWINLDRDFQL